MLKLLNYPGKIIRIDANDFGIRMDSRKAEKYFFLFVHRNRLNRHLLHFYLFMIVHLPDK
jgi:hypothetical protein